MDPILLVVVFLTALLSGVFGMAGGLVLLSFLALRMPIADAMVTHGAAQLVANGSRALISHHFVRGRMLAGYAVGACVAVALAFVLGLDVRTSTALVITGAAPFAEPLLTRLKMPALDRHEGAALCGGVATGMHLAAGTAGPLLDVFFLRTAMPRHDMVATKAATQVLGHGAKVAFFTLLARTPARGIDLSPLAWLLLGTASVTGTFAGRLVLDRLSEQTFRRWARGIVLSIGAVCIAQGLWALAHGN